MFKVLKWFGIGLAFVAAILVIAAAGLYISTTARLTKSYAIPEESISIPTEPALVSRGQRLVTARCASCHGENLSGSVLFNDPVLGKIVAPNISGGRGNGGQAIKDADFVRAIRHGIDHTGRPLLVMPSESFYYLNDNDLGDMIAYLNSTKAAGGDLPVTHIQPMGAILIGAGAFGKLIPAEEIAHQAARPSPIEPGVTQAYGDYLVRTGQCRTCHGQVLSGGKDSDPNAPPAPDITMSGELSGWSQKDFLRAIRTGTTPSGHQLNANMPWKYLGQMTDEELMAIWLYLQSLPAAASVK
jgi:mono/diheme cytochrome c family protein